MNLSVYGRAECYSSGSVYVGQQCFDTPWQGFANTTCFVVKRHAWERQKRKNWDCFTPQTDIFYVEVAKSSS